MALPVGRRTREHSRRTVGMHFDRTELVGCSTRGDLDVDRDPDAEKVAVAALATHHLFGA